MTPTEPTPSLPFTVEVTIAAPPDVVWDALRNRQQLRHWHGWDVDGAEEEIEVIYFTEVEESSDRHRLVLGDGDAFELLAAGEGTIVRLTRGPRDPGNEWDAYYEDVNEGWTTFLNQLRFAVERHPGDTRRTVVATGVAGEGGDPVEELGLADLGPGEVGSAVQVELAGEPATCEVWFRSANQVGLVVPSWGEGLLVVGRTPPSPARDDWAVLAVLSTYGFDDAAVAALEQRWTDWWSPRYGQVEGA